MLTLLIRIARETDAQDLAEYGVALAVIGAVGATVAALIAVDVSSLWTNGSNLIHGAL